MKPPPFVYHAPRSLDEALDALAGAGSDGKILAGGQSLIPLLNMRLASPGQLIDINRVTELDTLEVSAAGVRIGALARHARVERSDEAASVQPLLRQALRAVAHPVVRNRGTLVGSLAHADPAAEMPAVLRLLEGGIDAASKTGRRTIAADDFFAGPLESALEPEEIAVSAFFPALRPGTGTAFTEIARRHGDYAMAGVAAIVTRGAAGEITSARAGYLSVADTPVVLDLTEAAGERGDWAAAAAFARDAVEPEADIHASAEYRRQLVCVLTERALSEAASNALENS